jgi:WD40 repeat protein
MTDWRSGYTAFISYSHAADGQLSAKLQQALHHFSKPWYRLRAMRVFRDKTSLSATPELWPSIEEALNQSEWFLLMASPDAARSEWVRKEIEHWRATKQLKRMLILVTHGDLVWDTKRNDFDWERTNALPALLSGAFSGEPLYVDLRWVEAPQFLSRNNPRFQQAVADIASPLHGKPKDELIGEDIRQQTRVRRLVATTITMLIAFLAIAVWQWSEAVFQREAAKRQASIAASRQLAAQSLNRPEKPGLGLLLAAQAHEAYPTAEARQALLTAIHTSSPSLERYLHSGLGTVMGLSFSPDGEALAALDWDNTVALWNMNDGTLIRELRLSGANSAMEVALSPGGAFLAVRNYDDSLTLIRTADGAIVSSTPLAAGVPDTRHRPTLISQIRFDPSGQRLASIANEDRIILWDVKNPERLEQVAVIGPFRDNVMSSFAFSLQKHLLGAGIGYETVVVWDVTGEPREVARLDATPERATRRLTFHLGGETLSAVGDEGKVVTWNFRTGERLRSRAWPANVATALAETSRLVAPSDLIPSPEEDVLLGEGSTQLLLWNVAGTEPVTLGPQYESDVATTAFSPDGKTLAVSRGRRGRIGDVQQPDVMILDTTKSSKQSAFGRRLVELGGQIQSVKFAPNGKYLSVAGKDGSFQLLEVPSGRRLMQFPDRKTPVLDVVFTDLGKRMIVAYNDGHIASWNISDPEKPLPINTHQLSQDKIRQLSFRPSGDFLVYTTDEAVLLWSVTDRRLVSNLVDKDSADGYWEWGYSHLAWSENGERLAALARTLLVWDTSQPTEPHVIVKHEKELLGYAVSQNINGSVLVASYMYGLINIWDVSKPGGPYLTGETRTSSAGVGMSLSISPDRTTFALGGMDKSVTLWDARSRAPLSPALLGHSGSVVALHFRSDNQYLISGAGDGSVILWDLSTDRLAARAKRIANRNLSREEWQSYLGDPTSPK